MLRGILFLVGLSGLLFAQSYQGGIRGVVLDPNGAMVASSKVTLLDESTGVSRATVSSQEGEYVFNQVIPSTYSVIAEAPGFKKFERKGIVIATAQFVSLDVKMEVGQVTETVMVSADAPLLEASNASTGQVIDRQKLIDLPNLGRNPFMMSKLSQNVVQVGNPAYNRMQDQSGSSQISIAGGPVRGNNYLLDGIPITDATNRAIIIPSLEAVEEVKVQASTYDAEMARTGGGMFNTLMKSGGNQYHGSLLGYMRQTEWLANTFFNNRNGTPISPQPFRNYGASFGGPISIPKVYDGKNRTFFWFAWEGYRDTQANSTEFAAPSMLERAGNFSQTKARDGSMQLIYDPATTTSAGVRTPFPGNIIPANRIDPVGRNMAATYEQPTRAAAFFGDRNLAAPTTLPSKADQWGGKIDHQFFSWWRLSYSYLWYHSIEPGDSWFSSVSSPDQWVLDRKVNTTQINNLLTPNPTTVINLRYGFNRFPNYGYQASQGFNVASLGFANSFVRDIPSQTFPNVTMENMYNFGTNNNFSYVHHSRNLSGSLAKYMGRHSLKFGADYRRINADGLDYGNSSGQFTFNDVFTRATPSRATAGTGADLASMLLGTPTSGLGFVPTKLYDYADYYAMFFHDDFRVSQKLTINFGLRWEREYGLRERNNAMIVGFDQTVTNPIANNGVTGIIPRGAVQFAGVGGNKETVGNSTMNKWAPRFGAAWSLNDKTIVRGGYGIFWAPQFAIGSPYNPEGYTAATELVGSFDGNFTPAAVLSNPFPNGLNKPVGNSLGLLTGLGKNLTIIDPNAKSPMVQQFSLDIQRQLAGGIVIDVGYVGSRTRNLVLGTANININQLETGYLSQGSALTERVPNPYYNKGGSGVVAGSTVTRAQLLRPFSAFGNVNYQFSDLNSARYDSLFVKGEKRFGKGLSFLGTWTWSRNMDASSGGAGNNLNGGNVGPQNAYDMDAEYSLSNFHSPHRFTAATTYALPFGKGQAYLANNTVMDYIVGGWSVNAITVMQTGYPINISQNANNNSVIFAASQRPNATGVSPRTDGSLPDRIDGYINPAAFSQAPAFTFGNTSRTLAMRGPGQMNWDLSVFKTFQVYERFKAQFRAEALNAMNTPLFRSPNAAFGNAAFGRITSQANFPRMIQLGLRLYF